ncbi:MAG: ADP-glyceromanno-heptose 6-epimerase [Bacteroidales bacterium]|nr:ADP-glyceromanno-heptose 6-epimerase [Bacteroidales bacterium]MDD4602606.1 ADP-glyceromanno-heptose 6-epimerase [Bacteroidales bacterium]
MIIVTGAAGFIGSCMVSKLNNKGCKDIVIADDFSKEVKLSNIAHKTFREKVERTLLFDWLSNHSKEVEGIIHIGARTDTTEFDMRVFDELNLNYTKKIWNFCTEKSIPMIYASSAATYGDGSLGYDDHDPALSYKLQPLNPYGISKNEFDKWALQQPQSPPRWYGLKFFNVFGPNEYHKGRMASVVYHAFRQISDDSFHASLTGKQTSSVKLFRSHNPNYRDGEQLRDFIYVKDVIDVIWFLMNHTGDSGLYNVGTGKARTFLDLVNAVFSALNLPSSIEFIDTPIDIRDKYQYFTQANMDKLKSIGYDKPFYTLESGIEEYVQGYLVGGGRF